ncbi:hypothetical protein GCK72_017750 [Caenorhabditis remanei]|uniref:MMS19 nucleotide excision repair protein n=1 Tax=Caenorhabditis remanei TaxID=31234 RepID=A0A6A5G8M5_CAERE|nr:hypothetical protein GCK72_017750 [Caenorhabditis remanei]KAF1751196.1 hypothetical protein GCK72_017750 [Caenorhabditis remanei]
MVSLNETDDGESTQEWYRLLVVEKSMSLSDFMTSKRSGMLSDFPDEREQTTEELIEVISKFPNDFLQKEEVSLLLDYFLNSIESSALTGGAVIRGVHHLVLKSKNLPDNFEVPLMRVLFKEGNMQSWAQKERQLQYDILIWLLKNKLQYLKCLGPDFLATYMKSVSGERDPRCLVHMFSSFLEVSHNFALGPFTEDMFETIACYFPVEFRPQKNDTITREYLAASCASCLVSSPSFAPFCFLFIDEKLNDDDCSDEEYEDVLNLLIIACESFPPQKNLSLLEPIIDGIRKVGLNPKSKGEMPAYVAQSFEALMKMCLKSSATNPRAIDGVVATIIENSEPFVLQAEMGLCKKALTLLCCAFNSLTEKHSQLIMNQVIAWILNLIHGDSVNAAGNKADIVQEGLEYLIEWIQLASKNRESSLGALNVFEQSIFESCSRAREFKPREAMTAIYECAAIYFEVKCESEELINQSRSYIALALRTPVDTDSELQSLLKLIRIYSMKYFDQIQIVLNDNPTSTWNSEKVLPILCAISSSHEAWKSLKAEIVEQLEKKMRNPIDGSLECYIQMMTASTENKELFLEHFETFENVFFKVDCDESESISKVMQSISLLLTNDDHEKFMKRIASRYMELEGSQLLQFDKKYILSYLQYKNTKDLLETTRRKISDRSIRQLFFAIVNRSSPSEPSEVPEQYHVVEVKAKLLKNAPRCLTIFDEFLTKVASDDSESPSSSFEYLLDFESADSNSEKCRYETASPLWRQRIFCQIVPIFKRKFEEAGDKKHRLVEMLPHLLKFAVPLDAQQLNKQFAMLLPVLIQTISLESAIPSHVTRTIPMFLTISEPLISDDLHTVLNYLCSIARNNESKMTNLEDALNGLNILARRQPPKSLHSEVPLVVTSINKILGHKKRLLRMMAADVKNNW